VGMVILLVVLAAIYGIWFGLQRTYSFTDDDLSAQEQARAAMGEMVELIRTARMPDPLPSDPALRLVVVRAEANRLQCWTDLDRDEAHDLELVEFHVNTESRSLYRDSTRLVARWLSNDADAPLFAYHGANGAPLQMATDTATGEEYVVDPSLIREISITLLIDVIKDRAPVRHELTSVVQPRNLRQY